MTIALTLQEFLDWENIEYTVLQHPYTISSLSTAEAAHIPPHQLAKSVVLVDDFGFIMVVVPATQHVDIARLGKMYGRRFQLANEDEIAELFYDCEEGAVPALGEAYGFDVLVDEALENYSDIYIEGGDHRALIQVPGNTFHQLMAHAEHGDFSIHPCHNK